MNRSALDSAACPRSLLYEQVSRDVPNPHMTCDVMQKRKARLPISIAVVAIILFGSIGAYVGGYFLLGECEHGDEHVVRIFRPRWIAAAYPPMAIAEQTLTGKSVTLLTNPNRIGKMTLDTYWVCD